MDRDDYKEVSAFPMQKPNFEVFGIPQRTRKQRGWYQVQRHSRSRASPHICSIIPTFQPSSIARATGADVPIELVRLVGEIISQQLYYFIYEDRRMMMACALVCHDWAKHFHPKVFTQVMLRSKQRAAKLYQFDRSPACRFYKWFPLDSHMYNLPRPWIRLAFESLSELTCTTHLLTQTRGSVQDWVLRGPLPSGWKTIRSIHQALPRSLPRSFSIGITKLVLRDIQFQRFSDLLHLVYELPDLEHVNCGNGVTWGPPPATFDALPRRRATWSESKSHRLMVALDGSEAAARAWLHALVYAPSRNGLPCLSLRDLSTLLTLLVLIGPSPAVIPSPDSAQTHSPTPSWRIGYEREHCSVTYGQHQLLTNNSISHPPLTELCAWPGPRAYIRAPGTDGRFVASEVTEVTIDLSPPTDFQCTAIDWRELDKQIALLDPTRLVFMFAYRDHMLAFEDTVADPLMPSCRKIIKYALMSDYT